MKRQHVLFILIVVIGSNSILLSQESKPAKKDDANSKAKVDLPGHSLHGEAFDDGPRQAATLFEGNGRICFPTSSSVPQVQAFIEQGIGQLHGFWYFEAERSFRQAAKLDPDLGIAYWGMALANVNNEKRAKGFIAEAMQRLPDAAPLEARLITALESKLTSKKDKKEKNKEYVDDLASIVADFPDSIETLAFYGFALYDSRDDIKAKYDDVENILFRVLAFEPLHPVHHYLIHLWDKKEAVRALPSAARGGPSEPAIAHMWHMPGHIYSGLHRYVDAVYYQEASARVDHAHMIRARIMPDQIHNFAHNNEWLIRNWLYLGRINDAIELAKNSFELPRHPKYNTLTKGSAMFARARLFDIYSTYEMWDELIAMCQQEYLAPTDSPTEQARRLKYLGMAHAAKGDISEARAIHSELSDRLRAERLKKPERRPAPDEKAKSAKKDEKGKGERKSKEVLELEKSVASVDGRIKFAEKNFGAAIPLLKQAGDDAILIAKAQVLAGQKDAGVKAAESYLKGQPNRIVPHAGLVEVLALAERPESDIKTAFDKLRSISQYAPLDAPIFVRLRPLADKLGLPADWRKEIPRAKDLGEQPDLASLGPFKWTPYPAPDWALDDHQGKTIKLQDYRGKPTAVIFYLGYGCLHCVEQIQKFAAAADQFKQAGFNIVGITTDGPADLKQSVVNFGKDKPFPFPLVTDHRLNVFKAYRTFDDFENKPLHGTFLIDEQGRVRWQDIGAEPFADTTFVLNEFKRLLKPSAPIQTLAKKKPTPSGPINPEGVQGKYLFTQGPTHPEIAQKFFELAQKDKARLVILKTDSSVGAATRLLELWDKQNGSTLTTVNLTGENAVGPLELARLLDDATGVWVDGSDARFLAKTFAEESVADALKEFRSRTTVLAGGVALAQAVSDIPLSVTTNAPDPIGWLAGLIMESTTSALTERLKSHKTAVGIAIDQNAGLLVQGRQLEAIGSGEITVRLPDVKDKDEVVTVMNQKRKTLDWVALRRQAKDRASGSKFPTVVGEPTVPKGTLVIVGGGGMPAGLDERFISLAGGKSAVIAVIPISQPDPLPATDKTVETFRKLGAKEVKLLTGRTPGAVDQKESLEFLAKATGVWFGGGRQWRFIDAYEGTKAADALKGVLQRGGVIGGSSAGASIQGEYLARGNPLGPEQIKAPGYEKGLNYLPGVAIDQHFTQRNRFADLNGLIQQHPALLGIGIDESTALVVTGSTADIIGKGNVHLYDGRSMSPPDHTVLPAGAKYDLVHRKRLDMTEAAGGP